MGHAGLHAAKASQQAAEGVLEILPRKSVTTGTALLTGLMWRTATEGTAMAIGNFIALTIMK